MEERRSGTGVEDRRSFLLFPPSLPSFLPSISNCQHPVPSIPLSSYRIADFFVQLPLDDAKSRIADSQSDISSQVSKLENEIGEINERMAKLKVLLYGRFGKVSEPSEARLMGWHG